MTTNQWTITGQMTDSLNLGNGIVLDVEEHSDMRFWAYRLTEAQWQNRQRGVLIGSADTRAEARALAGASAMGNSTDTSVYENRTPDQREH